LWRGTGPFVVGSTLFGIREGLVGLLDLLETLLGVGVVRVRIRVMLAGQLPVGLADIVIGRPLGTPSNP
jgi:hypothetical protein